jgi:YgiT-type zinc finger domain-containing protein
MKETLNITICPTCDGKNIKKIRRNWRNEYRGQTYIVPSLEFYECLDCGERIFDRHAMRKIESHSPAYNKNRKSKRECRDKVIEFS